MFDEERQDYHSPRPEEQSYNGFARWTFFFLIIIFSFFLSPGTLGGITVFCLIIFCAYRALDPMRMHQTE